MHHLVLYVGSCCHLCDKARDILYPLVPAGAGVREINVESSLELQHEYGLSIPVFAVINELGETIVEKSWPFTGGQVKRMLAQFSLA